MSLKHELRKAYKNNEVIPVELLSFKLYQANATNELEHKVNGEWVSMKPPKQKYAFYSHMIEMDKIQEYVEYGFMSQTQADAMNKIRDFPTKQRYNTMKD